MAKEKNEDLRKAASLVDWNRRILSAIGVWPESRADFLFGICLMYYLYHLAMCFLSLYRVLGHLLRFTHVLIEVLVYAHIALRYCLMRKHSRAFRTLFTEMRRDFEPANYARKEESKAFLEYNRLAKSMIKILLTFPTLTFAMYFFKPLVMRHFALRAAARLQPTKNITVPFKLPYTFYTIYKINNVQRFAITYATHFPFGILAGTIQSAADCLILTLGCNLCGRLSALSQRIRLVNLNSGENEYKSITIVHQRLLRIGKLIEDSLSSMMLFHLFLASTLICIIVFYILIFLEPGRRLNLINIFFLISVNILRLYCHCWVGEYLIHESFGVRSAFYETNWYEMPLKDRKLIVLNLARSQFPLRFAAGDFGTFSIAAFADVMKSAFAYLSFLRNFI